MGILIIITLFYLISGGLFYFNTNKHIIIFTLTATNADSSPPGVLCLFLEKCELMPGLNSRLKKL